MSMNLTKKIVAKKSTNTPRHGMTRDGYTKRSGAPTHLMIQLEGEKIWRRLMCWQFSNCGTLFVKIKKEYLIVDEFALPR